MAGPMDLLAGAMTLVSITLQQSRLAIVQGQRPTRASAIISIINVTALGFSFGKVPTPFSLLLMLFVMVDLFIFYEFIRSKRRPVHMDTGANILRQGTEPPDLSRFMLVERTNVQILVSKPSAARFSTVLRSSIALRFCPCSAARSPCSAARFSTCSS